MAEYREGSVAARVAMFVLLVVVVGIFLYLGGIVSQLLVDIQLLLHFDPGQALLVISRLLLWLVISSGLLSVAIGLYLYLLSNQIAKEVVYPPEGMPVVFRTELLVGARAARMRWFCLGGAILLLLQPVLGAALWHGLTGGVW